MIIGYSHIGKVHALELEGCQRYVSGDTLIMLRSLKPRDVLVVETLHVLQLTTAELIRELAAMRRQGIHLIVLTPRIDTTSPYGEAYTRLIFTLDRQDTMVRESRHLTALRRVKSEGRRGGRPKLVSEEEVAVAVKESRTLVQAARRLGVSYQTIWRRRNGN